LGNINDGDLKELSEILTDIKTLLSTEPPENTQPQLQPSEIDMLMKALDNFGALANTNK